MWWYNRTVGRESSTSYLQPPPVCDVSVRGGAGRQRWVVALVHESVLPRPPSVEVRRTRRALGREAPGVLRRGVVGAVAGGGGGPAQEGLASVEVVSEETQRLVLQQICEIVGGVVPAVFLRRAVAADLGGRRTDAQRVIVRVGS